MSYVKIYSRSYNNNQDNQQHFHQYRGRLTSQNTHPMITRLKTSICKPKIYHTSTAQELTSNQALQDNNWINAKRDECNALL